MYKNKEENRVGMTNLNRNGLNMTIITYQDSTHITVRFEDGFQCDTSFYKFTHGEVAHPTNRKNHTSFPEAVVYYYLRQIGFCQYPRGYWKKYDNRWGQMELDVFHEAFQYAVEYDGAYAHQPQTVQMRDILKQELCDNAGIHLIKIRELGLPTHTNSHIITRFRPHDIAELKPILLAIIDDFNNHTNQHVTVDIDIERDKNDIIRLFMHTKPRYQNRIGETNVASNGQSMKIIAYYSSRAIEVEFEDGTIVSGVRYDHFCDGQVPNPNYLYPHGRNNRARNRNGRQETIYELHAMQRISEEYYTNAGEKMVIVEYNNSTDVTVKFEDGTLKKHLRYQAIINGEVAHKRRKCYHPDCIKATRLDDGQVMIFCSQSEAREVLGLYNSAISACLAGRQHSARGYTFERIKPATQPVQLQNVSTSAYGAPLAARVTN